MDSPPPTQVPLRDSLLDSSRSLQPTSPSAIGSANNSLGSPTHINGSSSTRDRDRDRETEQQLVSLSNGHTSALASQYSLAQAGYAHAAAMAAQLHSHTMMAAHAHSAARHHAAAAAAAVVNPMTQLMRKNLMSKPGGGPYRSPPPPMPTPGAGADHNACSLIPYRQREVAAFNVDGRELICLPQAFDLFLKDLVGGLHTVYTKLKRLDIQPVVCNVEQVRILRGLGAIQPGVNRCKLISCAEFDVLYDDCTNSNARPGRPPKRSPSIHASPETIEKLKKSRMDGADFSYDPRFFEYGQSMKFIPNGLANKGEHKSMLNGFPHHPYLPYIHMGVNPMMPQPVSAMALAATQFAMRNDPSAAKDSKAFMDQELMNRQSQERLASQLGGMFGAPPLADPLSTRRPDVEPKPMNLSNGHARNSLALSTASGKISDVEDDEDDVVNDEKLTDDENDGDLDDNSNDLSGGYNGDDMDKPAGIGRQDLAHANVGAGGGNQPASELDKILMSMMELSQKAFNVARCCQLQLGQDKAEIQSELLREKELRKRLEKQLEGEQRKGEALERRWRKEKKARRQLQLQMEGTKSSVPAIGGHHGNSMGPAAETGLDLAMKGSISSPEEPTRTQTTDAAESDAEVEKNSSVSDGERKISESSDRSCLRDPFDVFSAAAALSSSSAIAGGSPAVRFPAPYLSLIGSEVQ